jgi:hypothetical protein
MAVLFALYNLQERVGTFALQYGYMSPQQFEIVRSQVRKGSVRAREYMSEDTHV